MIPASNTKVQKESPVSQPQPAKSSNPATNTQPPEAKPEKKGAMDWLRALFTKLNDLVRDAARKIADVAKRSPLVIAAAAALAMLFLA
ncbi:MAG TPA: hypothetical protein VMJ10_08205 [Kofleriaceae bacterium]|nr:hypothetical protein [Kofleriaceae bacterium]